MIASNTWPDPNTYVTLTAPPVVGAVQGHNKDNETDSYVVTVAAAPMPESGIPRSGHVTTGSC
jgi:hypothetical protein